jgi:beta-N-acetylhexosaminidase
MAESTTPDCRAAVGGSARIASLVFASLDDGTVEELDRVLGAGVGGIVVTGAAVDLAGDGTLAAMLAGSDLPPLVGVDEEGGRVQRMAPVLGDLPSAREAARTLSPAQIRETARTHGEAMRALGITVDFAPVADVSEEPDSGPIGDRSYSDDPEVVTAAAGAFAAGLRDAGVLPTLKHFPGHGRASGDSHEGLVTTPPIDDMAADLAPFRTLTGEGEVAVMIGHLAVPGLTEGEAASLSPAAIEGLLRDEMGFDGLVVTDDLGAMDAIRDRYSVADAAVLAVVAGADMVLVPASSITAVADALDAAVDDGRLPEGRFDEAAGRVFRARGGCPGPG